MWHDVQQNTEEWLALRIGKLGGSSISEVMANFGKAFGHPAQRLAVNLAIEQITGIRQVEGFKNAHTDRGHEQEPIARALYEREYFCTVTNGGYFDSGFVGVSPDGLVDSDGIIEIKSVVATTQLATKERGRIDPAYWWQVHLNLQQSGRDWIDYVSFCSDFPEGKRLLVFRRHKEECEKEFAKLDFRIAQFRKLVEEKKQLILQ